MQSKKSVMALMGYVPALVVQYFAQHEQIKELPAKQSFKSVVMFTDVSGFTNLTESLSKLGNEGPELTAFVINRYMELLVKAISQSGGDILKFAGDAIIVVWPPSLKTDIVQVHEDLRLTCRMALQNALDIQNKLSDTCILPDLKLSVKIGFGVGDINLIYVGGVFNRSEYLATGEPLSQAFQSEHCATQGGDTIISQEVYELVKDYFIFDAIESENGQKFYCVKKLNAYSKVKLKAEATIIKNSINLNNKISQQLSMFIPAALKPYLEIGLERWGSELRKVTTLFINLGIDLSDAKTDSGLQRIQNTIKAVQNCIYTYEGSLNKLLMDDKGSTCISVFGLPPLSHQNDSIRAIQTAFLLEQELRKIKCKVAIGISTGIAYCGVVGTSGSRREYSVLGDCVNLAARIMQITIQPLSPRILIDQQTAIESQSKIHSVFWSERKVKGKEFGVQIYEPLIVQDDFRKVKDINTHLEYRIMNTSSIISSKSNIVSSFTRPLSYNNLSGFVVFDKFHKQFREYDEEVQPVGRQNEIKQLREYIISFLKELTTIKYTQNRIAYINGQYGIGKSFLVKTVLKNIQEDLSKDCIVEIMVSSLNPATKSKMLNSSRIILRNIFLSLAQKKNKTANKEFISQIYQQCEPHIVNLISKILNLSINDLQQNQQQEDLILAKSIKKFCYALFSQYLEQDLDVQQKTELTQGDQSLALILVIDDMQDTDEGSHYLFKSILKNFKNILLIGVLRDQYKEISPFSKEEINEISTYLLKGIKLYKPLIINLTGLKTTSFIEELLEKYFKIKQFVCIEEDQQNQEQTMFARRKRSESMQDLQEMVELLKKIRDPLMFWESKPELEEMDFNSLCLNYLYVITQGHPLKLLQIIKSLIENNYIIIDESRWVAIVTKQFKLIIKHEQWLEIDCPLCCRQINGPYIDKLSAVQQLILKQACVIGDIFDIQTLNYMNPFKDSIKQKVLITELNILYEQGILDILNMESENIYYRFTYSFFRETLYQRMTYAQRRHAHKNVAFALQKIPQPFDYHDHKEYQKMTYHWTQAQNRSTVAFDEVTLIPKLTLVEKKQLIIKKIKQLLDQNRKNVLLKSGYINKRSEIGLQWNWRFCCVTSEQLIVSQEDDNPDHILSVYLKNVYQIEKSFNSTYYTLTITTTSWSRGKQIFENSRKIYFALETEDELNEWVTYLEFAKAYAVYSDFVTNFGKITFPLSCKEYDFQLKTELVQDNRRSARLGLMDPNTSSDKFLQKQPKHQTFNIGSKKYKTRKSSIFADGYRGSTSSSQQNQSTLQQKQHDQTELINNIKTLLFNGQLQLLALCIGKIQSGKTTKFGSKLFI